MAGPPRSGAAVVEQDDPVAEGAGGDQAQVGAGVDGLEQGLAAADGDRVDVDAVLVDQVVAAKGGCQVGPAQGEVAVGFGGQVADLLGVDLADDGGVPVGPLQGPGVDDLGGVPPDAGELDHRRGAGRVAVGGGPEPGHQLVDDPAAEEGSHPR